MKSSEMKQLIGQAKDREFILSFCLGCILDPMDDLKFSILKSSGKLRAVYLMGPGRSSGGYGIIVDRQYHNIETRLFDDMYDYWTHYSISSPEWLEIVHHLDILRTQRYRIRGY